MKVIEYNAPDGVYQLPIEVVAKNRTDYYAEKDGFGEGGEDYENEFNFVVEDDFEAIDWLLNNMDFADVESRVKKVSDEINVLKKDFWRSSEDFRIIEIE